MIKLEIKKSIFEKKGLVLEGLEVALDRTTLLILQGYGAFAMCGALNVDIYNQPKMVDRKIICARAVGVKTLEELFDAPIEACSQFAQEVGWQVGMKIHEAFEKISQKE